MVRSRKESIFLGYLVGRAKEDPTNLDRRKEVRGRGRAALPPPIPSLQTWPPPPPNSLPGTFPYFYLLLPRLLAPSLYIHPHKKRRIPLQIHPLPCLHPSIAGARRQAGTSCRPRGSAVNQPWQPARNSTSSFSGHPQARTRRTSTGQGRINKYQNTSSSSSSNSLAESD